MTENRMYTQRKANIPVMRYCAFNCIYCSFNKFLKLSPCQNCKDNKNHVHMEVLQRTPPKTKDNEFITVGLAGDVSFMGVHDFMDVLTYCAGWGDRTFLIQSKKPEFFVQFSKQIPTNVIIGTTIETNKDVFSDDDYFPKYYSISDAPAPHYRVSAMKKLQCRKAVTIEPILAFHHKVMIEWMTTIKPEMIFVGYTNDHHQGTKFKLPEPSLEETMQLINELRRAGFTVHEKSLRVAWWEYRML